MLVQFFYHLINGDCNNGVISLNPYFKPANRLRDTKDIDSVVSMGLASFPVKFTLHLSEVYHQNFLILLYRNFRRFWISSDYLGRDSVGFFILLSFPFLDYNIPYILWKVNRFFLVILYDIFNIFIYALYNLHTKSPLFSKTILTIYCL